MEMSVLKEEVVRIVWSVIYRTEVYDFVPVRGREDRKGIDPFFFNNGKSEMNKRAGMKFMRGGNFAEIEREKRTKNRVNLSPSFTGMVWFFSSVTSSFLDSDKPIYGQCAHG